MKLFKAKSSAADEPFSEIKKFAKDFIALDASRSKKLNYSVESLVFADEMLDEASQAYKAHDLDDKKVASLANLAGSYIFEVLHANYGGAYKWYDKLHQPILVIGDTNYEVACTAIEKAKGRIINGAEDNIPFFVEGVIQKVKAKESALII